MKNKAGVVLLIALVLAQLGADYRVALPGYRYEFPRDNFNHPEYQTEWWYYTGNLEAADGHRFGFELTFFRQGTRAMPGRKGGATPETEDSPPTAWDTRDIYFAHLALSDIGGQKFYRVERVSRAGPGLAGADEKLARIWNGNWQVLWKREQQALQAVSGDFSLRLSMISHKPPVIHGEKGVSQKSAGAGHASHYISFTRLLTNGSIELKGKLYQVEGIAWMDHEFFTERLQDDQTGWDWLSLQLDNETEIMLYRFRRRDGTLDPFSAGTYVDRNGNTTHLKAGDFALKPLAETWKSPDSHGTYPIAWEISVPSLGIVLTVKTPLAGQEIISALGLTPSYWEGAITLNGTSGHSPIAGRGYLEMTGYDQAFTMGIQ